LSSLRANGDRLRNDLRDGSEFRKLESCSNMPGPFSKESREVWAGQSIGLTRPEYNIGKLLGVNRIQIIDQLLPFGIEVKLIGRRVPD
jgi:hypothetical protein